MTQEVGTLRRAPGQASGRLTAHLVALDALLAGGTEDGGRLKGVARDVARLAQRLHGLHWLWRPGRAIAIH
jgi:hypothetical protein